MPITTAHVWTFFWLHVGVILVVTAYYAVAAAALPNLTVRAASRFAARSWLAALLGVIVSLPVVVASLVFMNLGPPAAGVGALLGLGWIFLGLIGGAGIALHIGRGRFEQHHSTAAIRGGLLITLTWALPVIGWFFVLPLTIATGIGCLILGMIPAGRQSAVRDASLESPGAGGELGFADRLD